MAWYSIGWKYATGLALTSALALGSLGYKSLSNKGVSLSGPLVVSLAPEASSSTAAVGSYSSDPLVDAGIGFIKRVRDQDDTDQTQWQAEMDKIYFAAGIKYRGLNIAGMESRVQERKGELDKRRAEFKALAKERLEALGRE